MCCPCHWSLELQSAHAATQGATDLVKTPGLAPKFASVLLSLTKFNSSGRVTLRDQRLNTTTLQIMLCFCVNDDVIIVLLFGEPLDEQDLPKQGKVGFDVWAQTPSNNFSFKCGHSLHIFTAFEMTHSPSNNAILNTKVTKETLFSMIRPSNNTILNTKVTKETLSSMIRPSNNTILNTKVTKETPSSMIHPSNNTILNT